MIISVKKWTQRAKFILLFLLFTYVLSILFQWMSGWMEPDHYDHPPAGTAVKVFQDEQTEDHKPTMLEQLKTFYWYGG